MAENNKPTSGMKAAAKRALAWKEEGHAGGTAVGLNRAHQIVNGENLSDSTVKRMFSFFSRHEVDKKAKGFSAGEEGYPSPGRVAWDLWGGDAGFAWSRKKANSMKKEIAEQFIVEEFKKSITNGIGGTSSVNETPYNASHAEYYQRSSEYIEQRIQEEGGKNMTDKTTEPDPTGDIAVTKSMDSDLARRKIKKAMKALEKAMASLPDAGRASSVSVANETAPVSKEVTPDVSRASSVSVSNETAPVSKEMAAPAGTTTAPSAPITSADGAPMQGTTQHVDGEGEYSHQANVPVEPLHKASGTCADCGDSCEDGETKCNKCMTKGAGMAEAEKVEIKKSDDEEDEEDDEDKMEKADTCSDCGKADCTCKVYKSATDLINEAKMTKSVWGGAFGAVERPIVR